MQANYVIMCTTHMTDVVEMEEFIRDNEDDEEVMAAIPQLLEGFPVIFGGGAQSEVECIPIWVGILN